MVMEKLMVGVGGGVTVALILGDSEKLSEGVKVIVGVGGGVTVSETERLGVGFVTLGDALNETLSDKLGDSLMENVGLSV